MANILLVDDEGSVLQALGLLLKSEGHTVVPIRDSEKALEMIKTGQYDMLVTDLRMPHVDGMELLKSAHEKTPPIPSIIISAFSSEEVIQQSKDLGCTAYIQKPFNIQVVLDSIRQALSQK